MVETVEGIETVETAESPVFMRFVVHVDEKTELRGKGLGIIPPSPPFLKVDDLPSFAFLVSRLCQTACDDDPNVRTNVLTSAIETGIVFWLRPSYAI